LAATGLLNTGAFPVWIGKNFFMAAVSDWSYWINPDVAYKMLYDQLLIIIFVGGKIFFLKLKFF